MTVFSDAADVLFADVNLGQDALYKQGGKGAGSTVRILFATQQRIEPFGQSGIIAYDTFASVRVSEASPARGDTLNIGGRVFRIETVTGDVKGIVNRCGLSLLGAVKAAVPTTPADTTPDQFTFTDVTGASLSTVYTSAAVPIVGFDADTPISVVGGTYSVNGGSYTSSGGTLVPGTNNVTVRGTSSGLYSTDVGVALTVGGVSDTFTITTAAPSVDYFAKPAAMWPWYGDSHRPAMYHAGTNKTWFAYESVVRALRAVYVRVYDHTAGTWSDTYLAGRNSPQDADDHGNPLLWRDNEGYWYIAYGCHTSPLYLARTTNPGDPSAWTEITPMSGTVTYPQVDVLGTNDFYLWVRGADDGGTIDSDVYSLGIATGVTGGALTFGALTPIVQFGDGRCYPGNHIILANGEIVFPFTKAESGNLYRQNVFVGVYNPTTGAVRNIANSFSVAAGSLPLTAANLNNFRVINQSGFDHYGSIPSICLGADGQKIHIVYNDASSVTGQYTIKYTQITDGSATVLTPEDVGPGAVNGDGLSTGHKSDRFCPVLKANGDIDVYHITQSPFLHDWGGDISRRTRSAAGSWGSASVIHAASSAYGLNGVTAVNYVGHANARVIWCETVTRTNWLVGTSSDSLKCLAYGDAGFLRDPIPAYDQGWTPDALVANGLLWLDATQFDRCFDEPGDQVLWASRWAPQQYVPLQTNPARLPTFSHVGWNGTLPAFSFNGDNSASVGQGLSYATGPFAVTQSVIIVAERGTQDNFTTGGRVLFHTAPTDGGKIMRVDVLRPSTDAGQTLVRAAGSGAGLVVSTAPDAFANGAKGVIFSQLTDNALLCAVNGGVVGSTGDTGNTATTDLGIGWTTVDSCFAGKIAEIIVINRVITTLERQKLEGYAAWKWGIQASLASGHPYKTARP